MTINDSVALILYTIILVFNKIIVFLLSTFLKGLYTEYFDVINNKKGWIH